MLNDIRESEGNRREWIVEILKDIGGKHTGFLHKGELVRCKDCKWHSYDTDDECRWRIEEIPKDDDFCSYGERKESE